MTHRPRKGINLLGRHDHRQHRQGGTAKGDRDPQGLRRWRRVVHPSHTKVGASWIRRYTFAGVRRVMGLGGYPDGVSLATAREKSAEQRVR